MKRTLIYLVLSSALLLVGGAFAAPVKGGTRVAAGYPDWQGVEPANYIFGLPIEASDLRHRATVIVEFEAEKADVQLPMLAQLVRWSVPYGEESWEFFEMRHDYFVVFSNRGSRDKAAMAKVKAFLDSKDGWMFKLPDAASTYHDLRFPGGPDAKGHYPMVYVMPLEGTEPLCCEYADAAGVNKAKTAARGVAAQRQKSGWTDFTGVAEPKFVKGVVQAVAGRKSLTPSLMLARAAIASADPEQAREGQIVFDAINQARTDLMMRIRAEAKFSPVRAHYDVNRLLDYFPQMKKEKKSLLADAKPLPDAPALALILDDVLRLQRPDCKPSAAEAKKAVVRLTNYKKTLLKLKDHKDVSMQNSASSLDAAVDALIDRLK